MQLPQVSVPPIRPPGLEADVAKALSADPHSEIVQVPVVAGNNLVPTIVDSRTTTRPVVVERDFFPNNLHIKLRIVLGQDGKTYSVRSDAGNDYVLAVGSNALDHIIREEGQEAGVLLRKSEIQEICNLLRSKAESKSITTEVFHRVARIDGGIEVDVGDSKHTRIRVRAGQVEIVDAGSTVLFYRPRTSRPMAMPATHGNLGLLNKYLNLHPTTIVLYIAWITYTLAHAKVPTTKFVILVARGGQGSGKSALSALSKMLIDPSVVGVQMLPGNGRDLALDAQNAHVLCYDNVRGFRHEIADMLCILATGGALTTRQLYTDAEQQVHFMHGAVILNGIPSFIDQPDLAQRCLCIDLLPLPEANRKSDAQLSRELQADLPEIQRGLFDLIAQIMIHLPTATVTNPERMLDFVHWLAAMEQAQGVPAGTYQAGYSEALNQGQLDSLQDDVLAAAVVDFATVKFGGDWSGTPTELLAELNLRASKGTLRSREWPQNPISLSKKLIPLQASLLTQGIRVELRRGRERSITITNSGAQDDKY